MTDRTDFNFGNNWQAFLEGLDRERIEIAERSLLDFTELKSLRGVKFLDIGCGSGLFSYAAHNLGAERVVSFDVDPLCVECCASLREKAGDPANWEIFKGSVLDRGFLARLGTFDLVYSWGVLHHTGRIWEAVENAGRVVDQGGLFYIALYNKVLTHDGRTAWTHSFWTAVKKLHNTFPLVGKYVLEPPALAAYLAIVALRGENPLTHVANYKSFRGMNWRTDATDWLGGYPYEYATVEEVFKFVRARFPDFSLTNIKMAGGRGLNWFLFRRSLPGKD